MSDFGILGTLMIGEGSSLTLSVCLIDRPLKLASVIVLLTWLIKDQSAHEYSDAVKIY